MIQFNKGLICQHYEELMAHKDIIEKPKIRVNYYFLLQKADNYPNEMYYKYEGEVCDNFRYMFQFVKETDTTPKQGFCKRHFVLQKFSVTQKIHYCIGVAVYLVTVIIRY